MILAADIITVALLALAGFWAVVLFRARRHEALAQGAYPPTGQFVEIDGHKVHVQVMGQGPDLVLIHGSSGNVRDMTHSFAPLLAKHYRVIVFDRPGLGYTDRINTTGATITQQADLFCRAAQQLGVKRPIVLGHSYGGTVALAWAVNHPEDIAAVVTLATPSNPWESGMTPYYVVTSHKILGPLVIPIITAFTSDNKVTQSVTQVFHPDPVPKGYAEHFGPGLTLRRNSLRANALQRSNLLAEVTAMLPHYAEITAPAEIIHGTDDSVVNLTIHAEPLVDQIPGATLTRLEGVGHMPHHTAADQIIPIIHRAAARAGLHPVP